MAWKEVLIMEEGYQGYQGQVSRFKIEIISFSI